jgi:hypothetical protein
MKYLRKASKFFTKGIKETTGSIVGGAWDGIKPDDWDERLEKRRAAVAKEKARNKIKNWAWSMFVFAECGILILWTINAESKTLAFSNLVDDYGIALLIPVVLLIALITLIDTIVDLIEE